MDKRKQQQYKVKEHTVRFPQVGTVTLSPSRESKQPFCAWYGPHGETCSRTTGLVVAATLPGTPPLAYMACPLHVDEVHQRVAQFLAELGITLLQEDAVNKTKSSQVLRQRVINQHEA